MRVKAIQDLAQLADTELFEQIAEGLELCISNAGAIIDDAQYLIDRKRPRGAEILRQAADEEAAKVLVLLDAVRCPRATSQDVFARQLQYFNDHLAKGIYVDVCGWHPSDFAEVKRGVDRERKEFYLDGPNDVDWIFYNDILRRREEAIYVSFVENDGSHVWHNPGILGELGYPSCYSSILKIVHALSEAGCLTSAALKEIALQWRPIKIEPEMDWEMLRKLNQETLERLDRWGLLLTVKEEHYATITNDWPFPMYSLNLRKDQVKKEAQIGRAHV